MKEVAPEIGMADATFKSCEMSNNVLTVLLSSWDNRIIKILFIGVIRFDYRIDSIVSNVYEKFEEDDLLKEALALQYEKIPETHPFKVYTIRDIDDVDFFKVVAEKITVTKEQN